MKRFLIALLSIFVLAGCASNTDKGKYFAKKSDLENTVFSGQTEEANQLIFNKDNLTIITNPTLNNIKPSTNPQKNTNEKSSENHYNNIKIRTAGNTYTITGSNGLDLKLKKVGKRVISDLDGNEYSTERDLD
ncbi:lipoprotein [Rummeliibacillus stabekisii]|uniref:lipoprotein n=1 Tax=Rummeliibacillus stabekisii TaxID=241244 RepID=UPI00117330F5|nr:membrane lipoprotein lipid attachment site-containing protein [Rummeliibacillus stabekisii]MBB5169638.1 PBP1b-binding outer membrane lipoprotein LpoB [Rummeliibacillus stabekisii]GEL03895.1 hypothetical protein RST01_05220 [Rummeliibacillus stabekisii]